MRKSYVALLLMAGAAALTASLAIAQDNGLGDGVQPMLNNAQMSTQLRSRAAKMGVSSTPSPNDTVWVGYSNLPGATNYWKVGKGPNRPNSNENGLWTWENPVNGDSMQGWWSIRMVHGNASGAVRVDVNRPWWAIEMGNTANYVINEARSHDYTSNLVGNRTFGVVGVWHSDPGNTGAGAGLGVGWTPITGTRSAWMGLRNAGDLTVSDPLTGNAFNVGALQMTSNQTNTSTIGNGAGDRFPGYASQMDQILYRDIDVSGIGANNLTLSFNYATQMSTGKGVAPATRTGWFDGDPLTTAAGNFISAEAGPPAFAANALAPVDSFQVYVGEPVEGTWKGSDGTTRAIYDDLRRWFNEVVNKDKRLWLFSSTDSSAGSPSIVISNADVNALKSSGNRLRVVFRVHTNRGFDDQGTAFTSKGRGAARLDDVAYNIGAGAVTIGDFESAASDIDNSSSFTAEQRWKSTGKPPAIYFHAHNLASLTFEDLCGDVNSTFRICDLKGTVVSAGNHDFFERAGDPINNANHSPNEAGSWGMISPTVNLKALSKTKNAWDLTGEEATATADYYIWYAIYAGIFDIFASGNAWQSGMQNYPSTQPAGGPAPGTKEWGAIRTPGFIFFNPDKQCFYVLDAAKQYGLIKTSNPTAIPDSMRIMLRKIQTCYRFGVTAGCSPTDGCYFDNSALVIIDGNPQAISVDIWHWFQDTFPANETAGLPGTANFDTTAALIRTGLNTTQTPGASGLRFDVPGDSVSVISPGDSLRIDMVFRIRPGVGNYVTVGDPSTGLRRIPTSTTPVTVGDGSFWGAYEAIPGEKSSSGAIAQHAAAPSGWSSIVWNSARCDTQETNYFPVLGKGFIPQDVGGTAWQSTLHELDPHYTSLGLSKFRCFIVDPVNASLTDPNVVCNGTPPSWVTSNPAAVGYDGNASTIEYTSILPDGIFTPGTHVQYFFRRQDLKGVATVFDMVPDTNTVTPQELESSTDAHRWQEFSVLPDRWKSACMLYVDWNDRRGDERIWVSVADSIGATSAAHRGGHNGWRAPGNVDNHTGSTGDAINNPAYRVHGKNLSAGTLFDMYGVKASESLNTGSGSLGSRFAVRNPAAANKVHNKYALNAPTTEMLQAYYKVVFALFGDLNSGLLGPVTDKTADDVKAFEDYMLGATTANPVGVWVGGNGFAQSNFDWDFYQEDLNTLFFGMDLNFPGYRAASLNSAQAADLIPTSALVGAAHASDIYGVRNSCTYTQDVLLLNQLGIPEVVTGAEYQNVGTNGPYVAVSVKPISAARPWVAIAEGFDIATVTSRYDITSYGRLAYYYNALSNVFAGISGCPVVGNALVTLDVPGLRDGSQFVNFMNLRNNPLTTGMASVHFGLAKSDRVEIKVYDVAGRQVRNLVERQFPAGEHTITWDGVNDHGAQVARGVYFTQVKYVNSRFVDAKKLIVLK